METIAAVISIGMAVFSHSIESAPPIRTREQKNTLAEPSTSGRLPENANIQDIPRIGKFENHNKAIPLHDVYYINKNDISIPILKSNFVAGRTMNGKILSIIIDGFVHPLYNGKRQVIMLDRAENFKATVTRLEYVERWGVNQPLQND